MTGAKGETSNGNEKAHDEDGTKLEIVEKAKKEFGESKVEIFKNMRIGGF